LFRVYFHVRHDIDTGTELAELDGLPDLVDFALVDTESLIFSFDHSPGRDTYRSNPFLASTLYTRPIKVPYLGSALLVGANDLASNIPILEDRFHPSQLIISVIIDISQVDSLAQQSTPSIWD
jgi:hypothetical protein